MLRKQALLVHAAVLAEGSPSGPISPMSFAFLGTMRRYSRIILMASRWISKTLLMKARSGARGKAATKMVVKLYWITAEEESAGCWWEATRERTFHRVLICCLGLSCFVACLRGCEWGR